MKQTTCSFIGLGLIGGSVAKALKSYNENIMIKVYDTDSKSLELAFHEKIADTKIQLVPIAGNQVACGEWNELSIDRLYAYCTLLERHLNKGV